MVTLNPHTTPNRWKNFWARLFGQLCRGDIIEWEGVGFALYRGIYYAHYQLCKPYIHLIVIHSFTGGRVQAREYLIPYHSFEKIHILKRAEEFRSLLGSIEEFKEMKKYGYV